MRSRDEGLGTLHQYVMQIMRHDRTHESRGVHNTEADCALDGQVGVQDTRSGALASGLAHGSRANDVVNGLSVVPRVRLNLRVRLRIREVAEFSEDPVVPGGSSDEATERLDGLAHGADVEGGVQHAVVNKRGVEGVGGSNSDRTT